VAQDQPSVAGGLPAQSALPAQGGLPLPDTEPRPAFAPLGRAQAVHWDYRASAHSVRGHPMAGYRAELKAAGLPDARTVNRLPHGRRVRYAGVVINRQRPGTAKGVVFMTLEDETGFVNLVLWESVFERHPVLARTALLLGVTGKLQAQDGVVHLVAEALWQPQLSGQPALLKSRDFH
jgi:error-prone DNA polymerase